MSLLVLFLGLAATGLGWAMSSTFLLVLGIIADVIGLVWTLVRLGAGGDLGDFDCGDSGGGDGGGDGGGCGGGD